MQLARESSALEALWGGEASEAATVHDGRDPSCLNLTNVTGGGGSGGKGGVSCIQGKRYGESV